MPGAIASYEAALRIDNQDGNTMLNLGTAYQANKMLPKALDSYLRALQVDAKLHDAHYFLGTVYEGLNRKPQAVEEYKKYLIAQPAGTYSADAKERLKLLK